MLWDTAYTWDKLDSGGTRVAARVSESGASGERRRLFKSLLLLHAWPCAATYGGPAGFPRRMCTQVRNTYVPPGNRRSSLTEPFGHMPRGCRPSSSEPFFTPSCTHDTRRRSDLCCPTCRWSNVKSILRSIYSSICNICRYPAFYAHVIREKRDNEYLPVRCLLN